eukprot:TRINITY_DN7601_c0_g1_i1.p1 TRINITY_DN7601_c0_g1~~TRINITY_DN7601_c0_g1_i1.p1  ORF type:complete len:678 (+),score=150.77 TRINITY_DN7601_c0_g1_i1:83-2116(+)
MHIGKSPRTPGKSALAVTGGVCAGANGTPLTARRHSHGEVAPPWGVQRKSEIGMWHTPRRHSAGPGHEILAAAAAKSLLDDGVRRSTGYDGWKGASPNGDENPLEHSGIGQLTSAAWSKTTMRSPNEPGWSFRRPSDTSHLAASEASHEKDLSKLLGLGALSMPPRRSSRTVGPSGQPRRRRSFGDIGVSLSFEDEKQLQAAFASIGHKAAQKFTSVREALRYLDADRDGLVDRGEAHYFFRAYDISERLADQVFDSLLARYGGSRDTVPYAEFVQFLAPAFEGTGAATPGDDSTRAPSPTSVAERRRAVEEQFAEVLVYIRRKCEARFPNALQVRRFIGTSENAGFVINSEVRHLFRAFNLPETTADKIYDCLDPDGYGAIDYGLFMQVVCPHLEDLPGGGALFPKAPQPFSHGYSMVAGAVSSSTTSRTSSRPSSNTRPGRELASEGLHGASDAELLKKVMTDIGVKLQLKFKHIREAFRPLDLSRHGRILPGEMRSFMRGFGWGDDVADRVFSMLDADGKGEVAYDAFVTLFEAALGPANQPPPRKAPIDEHSSKVLEDPRMRRIMNFLAAQIGDELVTKHQKARDALKLLDLNNDGQISRAELLRYLRSKAFPNDREAVAVIFEAFGYADADSFPLKDFMDVLDPHSGSRRDADRWRGIQELRDLRRPGFSQT